MILGDNIIEGSIQKAKERFETQERGAMILLKEVADPERFGVPIFDDRQIIRIEEKPKKPGSPYAVIGIYFYDWTVFNRIRTLKPSNRAEYEITDVNNSYLAEGQLTYEFLEGWWTDAGTFDSLWRAGSMVREKVVATSEKALAAVDR